MDPDVCLKEIEEIINSTGNIKDLMHLVCLIDGLNQWICNGGYFPKKWEEGFLKQVLPGSRSLKELLSFTDPYSKRECQLELMSTPWGGYKGDIFIYAIDKKTGKLGTYCFSEIYVKVRLSSFLNIKKNQGYTR